MKFVSLDELLAKSDFVSLNCALTPQNRGLIGETGKVYKLVAW